MIPAKILVVEDERVVALHLRQQLSHLGYTVPAMATAGAQALKYIEELQPDVVLMDIHIEGDIDGIETARRIPSDQHVPVIYLTAYSEEATLERARQTRPYGYLLKPFSERELHAAIQMVLERCRADSALKQSSRELEQLVAQRTDALTTANKALENETAERLNAERALMQAQKMDAIGQLTGGVAHDFNNLMQVVIGNLHVLMRALPADADKHRELVVKALGGAKRAAELTQRLLAFARRQPLMPKPLDVNQMINELADLLQRSLGEAIRVVKAQDTELWLVESDRNQLESAFVNLVLNARDAMPEGGKLIVETRNVHIDTATLHAGADPDVGDYVMISVSDNGQGMSEDTLARAFEPFFTTKEVGAGSGLGLSQVYGFIKQSHGHVKIDSRPGVGTTVKMYMPRFTGSAAAAEVGNTVPIATVAATGIESILVVEDDADVRSFSVAALKELGYSVVEAADGPSAMKLLNQHELEIDLLFSDVVLPNGMNGAMLATKAVALRPKLKVLLTTGYARNAIVHQGRVDPGVELLLKPFSFDDLAARVRKMLDVKVASPA